MCVCAAVFPDIDESMFAYGVYSLFSHGFAILSQ